MKNKLRRVTAGLLLAFSFSPIMAIGQTNADLQAQISVLLQRVQVLQAQLLALQNTGGTRWCFNLNNNLSAGNGGGDVGALAQALATEGLFPTQGSYSNVTFDETLASAVSAFQERYRSEILTPAGLSYATGFLGVRTRTKLNSLYGCGNVQGGVVFQPSTQLNITSISPVSGNTGTQVTITGSGFTLAGNKIKFGSTGTDNSPIYHVGSLDGRTLVFSVPSTVYYACQYSTPACYPPVAMIEPGTYSVSVINTNGTSNQVTFTVTTSGVVNNTVPTISYISPTSAGRYGEVTIVGSGFTSTDSVQFGDLGTYISDNYVNSSTLTFTVPSALTDCNITGTSCTNLAYPTVTNGSYNIRVVNNNGRSNAVSFTVNGVHNY